jgi:hypothetical protein
MVQIGETGGSRVIVREVDPEEGRAVVEPVDESAAGALVRVTNRLHRAQVGALFLSAALS